jgi:hypothetical protein
MQEFDAELVDWDDSFVNWAVDGNLSFVRVVLTIAELLSVNATSPLLVSHAGNLLTTSWSGRSLCRFDSGKISRFGINT